MELTKLSLMLMGFCFFVNGYAMDKKEQLAKDLVRVQRLVAQAENQAAITQNHPIVMVYNLDYIEFVYGQHFTAIELAYEAHVASLKIVNDNAVSHKVRKDAELYAKKAFWILDKYNSKEED